ncbi:SDR family oxidoreductase [Marinobacterium mangrovicola]|uniref:3-oxoacyl-[acyl-carrier protein] reductase n=1 Tax=Marinobacterium mangrovicola TaxID=1476959 RepID=A0A4R1GP55_9GAMM|nr:SDR family oxidoreductase [Marinobacterium mangrovicola]TCK09070.1 3-oxoacyl-[acyl-carrier protein] reductase [Marinobacterium mangrovicola]
MNLNLKGRKAIVCGASKGLGKACALALAQEGVDLVINARSADALNEAAAEIRSLTGVSVTAVAADITTEAGRDHVLSACPHPDILVTNAGGPPPGDFREWDEQDWYSALDANMLTPIFLMKSVIDGMQERHFGRIINITSSAVKAPIPILGLSNGARSGLTGFVAGLARQTAAHNVTINNLLPGSFETDRLTSTLDSYAKKLGVSAEQVREEQMKASPAERFGDPVEFGAYCAFLCGSQAGFITGQNLLLDGGAYPGTL